MAKPEPQESNKRMAQIVAKAWTDAGFKKRLLTEPASVLQEYGVEVPAEVEIRVVENTDKITHLILPPRPGVRELSEEDLAAVAAGADSSNSARDRDPFSLNCFFSAF